MIVIIFTMYLKVTSDIVSKKYRATIYEGETGVEVPVFMTRATNQDTVCHRYTGIAYLASKVK